MANPASIADQESLTAMKGFWDNNPDLRSNFGVLRAGKLKVEQGSLPTADLTNQGQQSVPPATERKAYAKVVSVQEPDKFQYYAGVAAGNGYLHVAHVTFTGYGRRAEMVQMAGILKRDLSWLPRDGKSLQAFFPDFWEHVIRPIGEPKITEDETVKDGKDVWQCVAEYELVTTRQI